MSSHDGPSHQSIDRSHHETSYGSYSNQGYHASGQGIISINQQGSSNPLEELEKHCSHSAPFDSTARFHAPRCAESTRLRIIQIIEEWINGDGENGIPSSFFWLHGGAGVGKSALAQSLSEKFQEKNQLMASFFFFRNDPTRNKGAHLIPTLVSHLVDRFEEIVPFVEDRIRKNRALFTKEYQIQIRELLVKPLLALKSKGALIAHPQLIVIDGLDECENPDLQCELLRVIARAIPQLPYPLRVFITSRPEVHLTQVFNHDYDLQAIAVQRYNLSNDPDADMDIRKFLEREFVEIRRVHRLGRHLPHIWPDQQAVNSLVERSSAHFIYASTVIRYIRSPNRRPDERLEVILRLRPPQEGDQPYAQLDALYTFIFQCIDSHGQLEKICLVLGILYLHSKKAGYFSRFDLDYTAIETLLEMKAGDLVLLLDPIISLVAIDGERVRILHKSLIDYLLDFTRGGHLPFDIAQVHTLAATYLLKRRIAKKTCDRTTFRDFSYHCQYAYLNDTLKDYLFSQEVPLLTRKFFEFGDLESVLESESIIWFFFRTLSREDFDPTGKVYTTNLMGHFSSLVLALRISSAVDNTFWATSYEPTAVAKRKLDTLLMEWKPRNFNPMGIEMNSSVDYMSEKLGLPNLYKLAPTCTHQSVSSQGGL